MHDINFFSQLQSARKVSSRSVITILSVLVIIALNVAVVMFLNLQLDGKNSQLAQLNEYNNSPQSIQLLADAASKVEENRVRQDYYDTVSVLAKDIKAAGMLTTDRLDKILTAIPAQVTPSSFSYTSGHLTFECTSPFDADYLPRTIKAMEDTGVFVSVRSEGINFIDPTQQENTESTAEDGQPTEPYCTFTIECIFKEGGQ